MDFLLGIIGNIIMGSWAELPFVGDEMGKRYDVG